MSTPAPASDARRLGPAYRPKVSSFRPTPRELEILALAAEGLNNAEIGRKLWITEHTVKSHMKKVTAKLDTRNRAHSVAKAIRLGLI